jgi:hypothetical protein
VFRQHTLRSDHCRGRLLWHGKEAKEPQEPWLLKDRFDNGAIKSTSPLTVWICKLQIQTVRGDVLLIAPLSKRFSHSVLQINVDGGYVSFIEPCTLHQDALGHAIDTKVAIVRDITGCVPAPNFDMGAHSTVDNEFLISAEIREPWNS